MMLWKISAPNTYYVPLLPQKKQQCKTVTFHQEGPHFISEILHAIFRLYFTARVDYRLSGQS